MTIKIKPCPFCGGTSIDPVADASQGYKWGYTECANCGAKGPEVRTGYDNNAEWHKDAFDEWNTRFEETEDE